MALQFGRTLDNTRKLKVRILTYEHEFTGKKMNYLYVI